MQKFSDITDLNLLPQFIPMAPLCSGWLWAGSLCPAEAGDTLVTQDTGGLTWQLVTMDSQADGLIDSQESVLGEKKKINILGFVEHLLESIFTTSCFVGTLFPQGAS